MEDHIDETQIVSEKSIEDIVNDPNVELFYANGFTFFVGNSDVGIILKVNNRPCKVLNMSFSLAKTLQKKLNEMLTDLEEATGNEIMTTNVITEKFLQKCEEETDDKV